LRISLSRTRILLIFRGGGGGGCVGGGGGGGGGAEEEISDCDASRNRLRTVGGRVNRS